MPDLVQCGLMPDLVQCGWCPVIMIYDWPVIYLHFAEDHKIADGSYSLRHNIKGDDWDVAELIKEA